jgi:hypothetical protein
MQKEVDVLKAKLELMNKQVKKKDAELASVRNEYEDRIQNLIASGE